MSSTPPMTEDLKTLSERDDKLERISRACIALLDYRQADDEGVMVLTSREAIHAVIDAIRSGALIPSDGVEGGRPQSLADDAAEIALKLRRHCAIQHSDHEFLDPKWAEALDLVQQLQAFLPRAKSKNAALSQGEG